MLVINWINLRAAVCAWSSQHGLPTTGCPEQLQEEKLSKPRPRPAETFQVLLSASRILFVMGN